MSHQPGSHGDNHPSVNGNHSEMDPRHNNSTFPGDIDLSSGAMHVSDEDWTRIMEKTLREIPDDWASSLPQYRDATARPGASSQATATPEVDWMSAHYPSMTPIGEPQNADPSCGDLQQYGYASHTHLTAPPHNDEGHRQGAVAEPLGLYGLPTQTDDFEFDPDFDFFGFQSGPRSGTVNPEPQQQTFNQHSGSPQYSQYDTDNSLHGLVSDYFPAQYPLPPQKQHAQPQADTTGKAQYYPDHPSIHQPQSPASAAPRLSAVAEFQNLVQQSSTTRDHIQQICRNNKLTIDNSKSKRIQISSPLGQRSPTGRLENFPGFQNMFLRQQAQSAVQQPERSPQPDPQYTHTSIQGRSAVSKSLGPLTRTGAAPVEPSYHSGYGNENISSLAAHRAVTPSALQSRPLTPLTASASSPLAYSSSNYPASSLKAVVNEGNVTATGECGFGKQEVQTPTSSLGENDQQTHQLEQWNTSMLFNSDPPPTTGNPLAQDEKIVVNGATRNTVPDQPTPQQRPAPFTISTPNMQTPAPSVAAPVMPASTNTRKPRKPKTGQKIDVASDQLLVQDFDHAQRLAIKRRKLTIAEDDRAEVVSHPEIWIPLISQALDAQFQPQPDKADEYTPEALAEWTRWQKEHEAKCWDILTHEPDAKAFAQACAWFLYNAVLEAHRDKQGPREVNGTVANGGANPGLNCSGRLLATINGLQKFTIVRYDLLRLDRVEDCIASPQGFVDRKVNNMWTNYRKKTPHVSPKIAEAGNGTPTATKATRGKRKATEMTDVSNGFGGATGGDLASNKKQKMDSQPQAPTTPQKTLAPGQDATAAQASKLLATEQALAASILYTPTRPLEPNATDTGSGNETPEITQTGFTSVNAAQYSGQDGQAGVKDEGATPEV